MKHISLLRIKILIAVSLGIILTIFLTKSILFVKRFMAGTGLTPQVVSNLLLDGGVTLRERDGRTNILILGMGGGNHVGNDLTDTMIVLSLRMRDKTMSIIALPRDVWSDTLRDRINSAYHYGEEKKPGGGMTLAKAVVEEVTGLPIYYTIKIDFSGFKEIIDLVGGIEVSVEEAFTDTKFPILGKETDDCGGDSTFSCRYETIYFDSGVQTMDGTRTLKYVRSRHARGDEGSDFARGRRQQKVLIALKQKLVNPKLWISPTKANDLFKAFDEATDTDMNIGELATVAKITRDIEADSITRVSLEAELYEPPLWRYGRYVLVPKVSLGALHAYILEQLQ